MQPPETTPRPSRIKGFIIAVVATIISYAGTMQLFESMAWPANFILFMIVFIVIDLAVMFVLDKIFRR